MQQSPLPAAAVASLAWAFGPAGSEPDAQEEQVLPACKQLAGHSSAALCQEPLVPGFWLWALHGPVFQRTGPADAVMPYTRQACCWVVIEAWFADC